MTSIDEALERFTLIDSVGSEDRNEACSMSLLAWVHGDGLTDSPPCAHRLIRQQVISVQDAEGRTHADRARIVRAGERGVLDTWWIPTAVILRAVAEARVVCPDGSDVDRLVAMLGLVEMWKWGDRDPSSANLSGADLSGADLSGTDLSGADLSGADLYGADLSRADRNVFDAPVTGWKVVDGRMERDQ